MNLPMRLKRDIISTWLASFVNCFFVYITTVSAVLMFLPLTMPHSYLFGIPAILTASLYVTVGVISTIQSIVKYNSETAADNKLLQWQTDAHIHYEQNLKTAPLSDHFKLDSILTSWEPTRIKYFELYSEVLGYDVNQSYNDQEQARIDIIALKKSNTDPYKILGINRYDEQDTIRKAYRSQQLESHPDYNSNTTTKSAELNRAYNLVKTLERRKLTCTLLHNPTYNYFTSAEFEAEFIAELNKREDAMQIRAALAELKNSLYRPADTYTSDAKLALTSTTF